MHLSLNKRKAVKENGGGGGSWALIYGFTPF